MPMTVWIISSEPRNIFIKLGMVMQHLELECCVKKMFCYLQRVTVTARAHMIPRSGELRTQKLKSHLVRTQSLNVLPFKPGVGQYIAIHATLTAWEFFLAYFYPSSPFTCIFSKTSPNFFLCWPAE